MTEIRTENGILRPQQTPWLERGHRLDESFPGEPLASPENRKPEKSFRTSTFLITLSPKGDVTDATVQHFCSYLKKKMQQAYAVLEVGSGGQRHLHCACVSNVPVEKRNIQDYWSKILMRDYPGSIGRYACKVTIMYDHKWYDEYLRKGGDVVYDAYERSVVGNFFPDEETQQRLIDAKGVPEARMHIVDLLLSEWVDKDPNDASYESAISFVKYRMYYLDKQPYFVDPRKLQQMCWFMYEKRNRLIGPNVDDKNFACRMTGNTI